MHPALDKLLHSSPPKIYWLYRFPIWLRVVLGVLVWPVFVPILIYPQIRSRLSVKIGMLLGWITFCVFIAGLILFTLPNSPILNKDAIAITVVGIENNAILQDDIVIVTIKTDPAQVDELTVNGEKLNFGWFWRQYKYEKTLPEGDNSILIIAKKDGKRSEKKIDFKIDLIAKKNRESSDRERSNQNQRIRNNRPVDQKVTDLAGEIFGNNKGYRSDQNTLTATLTFRLGNRFFFNETDTLEGLLSDMVKFGTKAFEIEQIDQIEIQYVNVIIDQFGAESESQSMSVSMSRFNFSKYNFDNIKGSNFYNSVKDNITLNLTEDLRTKINFQRINVSGY